MREREWHGKWGSPEYWVWALMLQRCHNPKSKQFHNYGGRGITVCDEWRTSFGTFLADMGEKPTSDLSLDRIDNNKGYSRGNCRWADQKTQCRNTRSNSHLTLNGETRLLCEWAEATGISASLISNRIGRLGWSVEKTLTTPPDKSKYQRGDDTIASKARQAGIPDYIVYQRLKSGWHLNDALSTPVKKLERG